MRSNQSLEPTAGRCVESLGFYERVPDVYHATSRQRWLSSFSLGPMVHNLVLSMAALSLASVVVAQVPENSARRASDRQQPHTLQTNVPHAVRMQYVLFVPIDYDKNTETWPLILYLHGGSVRGDDIHVMKRWGLAEKIEKEPNFPFIVVSPQCHKGEIWTDVDALGAVLDEVCRTHRV